MSCPLQMLKRTLAQVALGYLALSMVTPSASFAKTEYLTSAPAAQSSGQVQDDQFLELNTPSSEGMRLEGEQAMRYGNYDRAIAVLKKSVQMSPTDMDGRILFAEALEKKLLKQQVKDPALYNSVMKQWLIVSKNGNFMDQKMQGRAHLQSLAGTAPKHFESDAKFLSRILIPEDGSVKVALNGNRKIATTEQDPIK
ncbi:MAG: hypothetical protein P4L53_24050 [Candidatus Obscuribacterales bacterium]|nr:hypothetical protein [Candidatus Obscuribacterales bacterium]